MLESVVNNMQAEQPMTPAAAAVARPPQLQRPDGTPIRVLVVDDEPSLAELLASVLRYEGWEIRTAGDGASAVRAARDFRPDAVVLDIMLPDFDGLEVLRRVRAEIPHVCVLFLTARDAVEDRVAGITAEVAEEHAREKAMRVRIPIEYDGEPPRDIAKKD